MTYKGSKLSKERILDITYQLLNYLDFINKKGYYHLNIHLGNILIDLNQNDKIYVSELENSSLNLSIRNEHYYDHLFDGLDVSKTKFNSNLSGIFNSSFNIFEKFELVSLGRVIYELATGRELKANYPDEVEYSGFDEDISNILKLLFNKKQSKVNSKYIISYPEVSIFNLLKLNCFDKKTVIYNHPIENKEGNLNFNDDYGSISEHVFLNNTFKDYDNYSFLKEKIFNQEQFIKNKLKNKNNTF